MEVYQIVLLICVFVGFFYLSVLVYVIGQMREFRLRLKRRIKGLNLLLTERAEILAQLVALFDSMGVEFSEEDRALFKEIAALQLLEARPDQEAQAASKIKEATSRFKYVAQANRWATQGENYPNLLAMLDDLEKNYRTCVLLYNADVVGYNYWIRIPALHWLGFILGHRRRNLLS